VARAYQRLTPAVLPHNPKARSLGSWKKAFLALMGEVAKHVGR
jgi:hypothetical protein